MSAKFSKQWKTVPFEKLSANIVNPDFDGLIGIEECHDYDVENKGKNNRQKDKSNKKDKPNKKRKSKSDDDAPLPKKVKSTVGDFTVQTVTPKVKTKLTPNKKVNEKTVKNGVKKEVIVNADAKSKNKTKRKKKKKGKKPKVKTAIETTDTKEALEERHANLSNYMQAWLSFGIPEPILKAMSDQQFTQPTAIQGLTLAAAMHGRRDILGAAETGSGKTLAFGIPIISGIMELKEKALRGENIDVPHKIRNTKKPLEDNSKPKIININKLTKEEIKKMKKKERKGIKIPKMFVDNSDEDSDEYSDSDEDNDDEADSDDENEVGSEDEDDVESEDEDEIDSEDENKAEDESKSDNSEEDEDISADENDDDVESNAESNENDDFKNIDSSKENGDLDDSVDKPSIFNSSLKPLYALILTPTRELAIQVKNHLVAASKYTDIRVAVVVGGMAQVKQERILAKGPEIVVATPGRLWEMIQQGNDHLSQVTDIRYLAIDETDRMIERGHFEELHLLLDKINDNEYKRGNRQNFVFSATLTMVHDLPMHLKTKKVTKKGKILNKKIVKLSSEQKLKKVIEMLGISDPKVVDVTTENRGASNTLTECRIVCPIDHKDYYLYYVLKRHAGRTIIFCNSIGCVKRLAQLFSILQCNPLPLHANMQQRQRLKNLDRFRDNPLGILIATDVAARGLDIPDVDHVIHYQVPRTAENYVHRSGRTARAHKEGITILIMEPTEVQNYVRLCRTLKKEDDLPHFPVPEAFLANIRNRVNLAREIDHLELQTRKLNSEIGWYEKTMREMDIIVDEGDRPRKVEKETAMDQKTHLLMKRKQLNSILSAHLFPKGFNFKYPTSNDAACDNLTFGKKQNALEAMKSAIESGLIKKIKKGSKNEATLSLISKNKNFVKKKKVKVNDKPESKRKMKKNKWKKMKKEKEEKGEK